MTPEIWRRPILTPLRIAPNSSPNIKKLIFLDFWFFWSSIYPYKPKKSFGFVGVSKNWILKNRIFKFWENRKFSQIFQKIIFLKINASKQNKWSFHCQNISNHQKTEFEPILRGCVLRPVWFLQNVALKKFSHSPSQVSAAFSRNNL